ncbi:MAG TPA: hypothetical protein VEU29_04290 [Actinomycetota bacterium]|nr:hypothetical protein [Actinomycetota bacterium]
MTKSRKAFIPAVLAIALAIPLTATSALAQTQHVHEDEVVFASQHPCTEEPVEGDTKVKMTITTTENSDGTTTVKVRQHTHGQQLLGTFSQDWYVFNDAQDEETTYTLFGPAGSVDSWTRFIHTTEDVAFNEEPGKDDYFQRTSIVFSPLLPPVLIEDERPDCR